MKATFLTKHIWSRVETGLKIYQSFLACAEAWRQRRRRSKVSFILFRMTLFQPFAVKMLQKIASLLTSKYYSQERLVNKLLLNVILARQQQKQLAQSGKLCRNFTFPARYFCCPGQVGKLQCRTLLIFDYY